jgi:PPM family protein phosphatase
VHFYVGGCSHLGQVRSQNDDCFCIGPKVEQLGSLELSFPTTSAFFHEYGLLCAVADGMGGYAGGALAARTVVQTLSSLFYAQKHAGMDVDELACCLERDLFQTQHALEATLQREDVLRAGTTLAGLVLLPPDVALVFHCGDSRVLRASGGYVRALTLDHAPLAAEIAAGRLDESHVATSPLASKVSRALGLEGDRRVEINTDFSWEVGDTFLLCSDGFHGTGRGLTQSSLREHLADLSHTAPGKMAEQLVDAAVTADGSDNVTLVTVRIAPIGPAS